jgi:hypothetical protein
MTSTTTACRWADFEHRRPSVHDRFRSFDLLIVREVPTTRQPRSSSAYVTPRPIPLEAPVTMATGCWLVFIECPSGRNGTRGTLFFTVAIVECLRADILDLRGAHQPLFAVGIIGGFADGVVRHNVEH